MPPRTWRRRTAVFHSPNLLRQTRRRHRMTMPASLPVYRAENNELALCRLKRPVKLSLGHRIIFRISKCHVVARAFPGLSSIYSAPTFMSLNALNMEPCVTPWKERRKQERKHRISQSNTKRRSLTRSLLSNVYQTGTSELALVMRAHYTLWM